SFCLTLSEAMGMGVPVLSSDAGAMRERVIDGQTGFLFKTGDVDDLVNKIQMLYDHPANIKKVQENIGKMTFKTIEENSKDYESVYRFLLTQKDDLSFGAQTLPIHADNPIVSIIALSYNQVEYTQAFIESLFRHTNVAFELILIDNASDNKTIRYLNEVQRSHGNAKIIFNEENLGFPKGVNQGIRAATGKYFLIANNDIVVTDGWLERMVELAESNASIGIVGPMSNIVSGVQLDKNAKYNSLEEMHQYAAKGRNENGGKYAEFPRVAFLCTLIKREVIEKIGGLDERFSPGNFEDDDFCLRAQVAGYKTVIAQDVFIHHYGSKSFTANGVEEYNKRLEQNKQIFIDKWGADPNEIWLQGKSFKRRELLIPLDGNDFAKYLPTLANDLEKERFENVLRVTDEIQQETRQSLTEDVLVMRGLAYLGLNNAAEAKISFEETIKTNPKNISARKGLVRANKLLGLNVSDYSFLRDEIAELLSTAEESINKEDIATARKTLRAILEKDPLHIDAMNDLSVCDIIEQNIEPAVEKIMAVLEIDQNNETAQANLNYVKERATIKA
ncbi:MAG TPA: glycosyltransferase, partial [Bacteroidota bacterium]|nr:glycosyltransferase [Bacteroidota bacterium]